VYIRSDDSFASISDPDASIIRDFAHKGGGLVLAGIAWYWAGLPGNEHLVDYPTNKLLRGSGLFLTGVYGSSGSHRVRGPGAITLPNRAFHAVYALEELISSDLDEQTMKVASTVVSNAMDAGILDVHARDYEAKLKEFATRVKAPTALNPVYKGSKDYAALVLQSAIAKSIPVSSIFALPAAADFPGRVASGSEHVSRTVSIDGSYEGYDDFYVYSNPNADVMRSTGMYAAAGEAVTIHLPSVAVSAGLGVLIGCHTDKVDTHRKEGEAIERVVEVTRRFELTSTVTTVGSALGGLIYITVPAGTSLGRVDVAVAGAYDAPTFVLGRDTDSDWNDRIKYLPAPWAEFISPQFIITVPREDAMRVVNPVKLMTMWEELMTLYGTLGGQPPGWVRPRPERFVTDRQISNGWMHSGYPLMGQIVGIWGNWWTNYRDDRLIDADWIRMHGSWGPFHELGHNHQYSPWILPGTTETTCNLWSVYLNEHLSAAQHSELSDEKRRSRLLAYMASGPDFDAKWEVWTALETYLQLKEAFGWGIFADLFRQYRQAKASGDWLIGTLPTSNYDKLNEWARRSSLTVNKNLGPFYTTWGFSLSSSTLTQIGKLPDWLDDPMAVHRKGRLLLAEHPPSVLRPADRCVTNDAGAVICYELSPAGQDRS